MLLFVMAHTFNPSFQKAGGSLWVRGHSGLRRKFWYWNPSQLLSAGEGTGLRGELTTATLLKWQNPNYILGFCPYTPLIIVIFNSHQGNFSLKQTEMSQPIWIFRGVGPNSNTTIQLPHVRFKGHCEEGPDCKNQRQGSLRWDCVSEEGQKPHP